MIDLPTLAFGAGLLLALSVILAVVSWRHRQAIAKLEREVEMLRARTNRAKAEDK